MKSNNLSINESENGWLLGWVWCVLPYLYNLMTFSTKDAINSACEYILYMHVISNFSSINCCQYVIHSMYSVNIPKNFSWIQLASLYRHSQIFVLEKIKLVLIRTCCILYFLLINIKHAMYISSTHKNLECLTFDHFRHSGHCPLITSKIYCNYTWVNL